MAEENQLLKTISDIVDAWVGDLVKTLASRDSMAPKRGLWDRFKGGISNLVYGRDHEDNPYYWRNRFGDDLGAKESFFPGFFTLSEYGKVRFFIDEAERKSSEAFFLAEESSGNAIEKLKIVRMLRAAGEDLKSKLFAALAGKEIPKARVTAEPKATRDVTSPSSSPSSAPTPAPSSAPKPAPSSSPSSAPTPAPSSAPKPAPSSSSSSAPKPAPSSSSSSEAKPAPSSSSSSKKIQLRGIKKSLAEALEAIRKGNKSSIRPEDSWLTEKGYASHASVPKLVAWLSMKSIDISNDEKVEEVLRREFPKFKGMGGAKGNALLKILKTHGVTKEEMLELGASESDVNKLEAPAPTTTTTAAPAPAPQVADKGLSSLYEDKDTAEDIQKEVATRLILPILKVAEGYEKNQITRWWETIKKQGFDKEGWIEFIKDQIVDSIISLEIDGIDDADDVLKRMS